MKFINAVLTLSAVLSSASATPAFNRYMKRGGVPENLVPEFGVQRGQTPDGTGNCDGFDGFKIPCSCPPDRKEFISVILYRCLCSALYLTTPRN